MISFFIELMNLRYILVLVRIIFYTHRKLNLKLEDVENVWFSILQFI